MIILPLSSLLDSFPSYSNPFHTSHLITPKHLSKFHIYTIMAGIPDSMLLDTTSGEPAGEWAAQEPLPEHGRNPYTDRISAEQAVEDEDALRAGPATPPSFRFRPTTPSWSRPKRTFRKQFNPQRLMMACCPA